MMDEITARSRADLFSTLCPNMPDLFTLVYESSVAKLIASY